jgi:hypothetical protein
MGVFLPNKNVFVGGSVRMTTKFVMSLRFVVSLKTTKNLGVFLPNKNVFVGGSVRIVLLPEKKKKI